MLLADRVAIVSGVGPGVGRSVALRCAQEGAKVVLACRGVEKAEAIAAEVRDLGRDVLVQSCDVTQPEQCQALVDATVEAFGRLDVLVNNAFATGKIKPLMKADVAANWRTPFEVNVYGTLDLSQRAALAMNDGGSIVMIGTQSALVPEPGLGSYGASKAALAAASKALPPSSGLDRSASTPWFQVTSMAPTFGTGSRWKRSAVRSMRKRSTERPPRSGFCRTFAPLMRSQAPSCSSQAICRPPSPANR